MCHSINTPVRNPLNKPWHFMSCLELIYLITLSEPWYNERTDQEVKNVSNECVSSGTAWKRNANSNFKPLLILTCCVYCSMLSGSQAIKFWNECSNHYSIVNCWIYWSRLCVLQGDDRLFYCIWKPIYWFNILITHITYTGYLSEEQEALKYLVLMTIRSRDWLLVPFWFFGVKIKKDRPAATSLPKIPSKGYPNMDNDIRILIGLTYLNVEFDPK